MPSTLRSSLSASRDFSSTTARRKEKGSDDSNENKEERKEDIQDKPRQEDTASRNKSSEPTPIPGAADGKGAAAGGGSSGDGGDGSGRGKRKTQGRELIKPSVPDVYPQVMAIPIAQRPLFPGFYKAITIRDPNVIAAVQELLKRGQSYVGAFLFKDQESSKDVIDSPDEVYDVGTFCQVTGAFPAGHGEEKALQAVLYPHRRIKMSELIAPNRSEAKDDGAAKATIEAAPQQAPEETGEKPETDEHKGAITASFEEQKEQKEKPTETQ